MNTKIHVFWGKLEMKYGYARVNTFNQDLDVQLQQLKLENCDVIYKEKFTRTSMEREELKKVLSLLKEEDKLVVTKLDHLARNSKEGIEIIDDLFKRDINVHVLNVGLLENTTMGRFFANHVSSSRNGKKYDSRKNTRGKNVSKAKSKL